MDSLTITFTGQSQLELRSLPVEEPGPGEVLVATQSSLVSTGTELICYLRNFEPGTHWHMWVQYPFFPGYSNAGTVVARGPGADRFEEGQLVAYRVGHRQYAVLPESALLAVPPGVTPPGSQLDRPCQDCAERGAPRRTRDGRRRSRGGPGHPGPTGRAVRPG